jgi:mannitol/fructose-specific phosphotransferase system IIA component (Ntr-type)
LKLTAARFPVPLVDAPGPWQDSLSEESIHIVDTARPSPISVANKWELIKTLHAALCKRENLAEEVKLEIMWELMAREKLMSTGIGEQMAIPHAVIPSACRFMTECAILKDGIDFESIDGTKAFVVVMLVAPKSALHEHLKVMASIAKVFYKAETRQRVIAATTPAEALAAIRAGAAIA